VRASFAHLGYQFGPRYQNHLTGAATERNGISGLASCNSGILVSTKSEGLVQTLS
jgi:hypothetical protein